MSHLGKLQTNYTTDDSQNYLMLREPKKAYYISQKEIDYDLANNPDKKGAGEQDFEDLFAAQMGGNERNQSRTQVIAGNDKFMDEERKEDLVRKTIIKKKQTKAVESNINQAKGLMNIGDDKMLDLDSIKSAEKYKSNMQKAIIKRQKEIISKIRATFNPLQCLQFEVNKDTKIVDQLQKFTFDAWWQYEVVGTKFELQTNPIEQSILNS